MPSRRTAAEVPWVPPFQYRCTNGHAIGADVACDGRCPACIHGQPCEGLLERFGPGSRS